MDIKKRFESEVKAKILGRGLVTDSGKLASIAALASEVAISMGKELSTLTVPEKKVVQKIQRVAAPKPKPVVKNIPKPAPVPEDTEETKKSRSKRTSDKIFSRSTRDMDEEDS